MNSDALSLQQSFATLRRFARQTVRGDACELCSAALGAEHGHLLDAASQKMLCCCEACAILLDGQVGRRYRRVASRVEFLEGVQVTDGEWCALGLPVELAFIYWSTPEGKWVAYYPGPLGAVASSLELGAWTAHLRENAALGELQPDIEAFLVRKTSGGREFFRVPMTECHKLVGLLRLHWQGMTGGSQVWEEVGRFFEELKCGAGSQGSQSSRDTP